MTVVASMDGLIAVMPFADVKMELKRVPEAAFKVYQVASRYAMQTFYFNLHGVEHNQYIKHPQTAPLTKKLRDFYTKNSQL
jgi:hypothetical protein